MFILQPPTRRSVARHSTAGSILETANRSTCRTRKTKRLAMTNHLHLVLASWLLVTAAAAGDDDTQRPADRPLTTEQLTFFEKKIRPVLATKCYSCHSAET